MESVDPEGACLCENGHEFWDTETWEWKTLRRAQDAERALVVISENCVALANDDRPDCAAARRLATELAGEEG